MNKDIKTHGFPLAVGDKYGKHLFTDAEVSSLNEIHVCNL